MLGLSNPSAVVLSAAITATIAIASILINGVVQARERTAQREEASNERLHQRAMASDQRRHDSIAEAYPKIARWMITETMNVEAVEYYEPQIFVPARETTEERNTSEYDARTQVYAYGTDELKRIFETFTKARRSFWWLVERLWNEQDGWAASDDRDKFELFTKQMRDSLDTVSTLIRDELAGS